MTIRKKFTARAENMTLGRVMVEIGVLALLSATVGCQATGPYKMYSGPELDRSQVALIQSQDSSGVWFIKPKYVEIKSIDAKRIGPFGMGSIPAALVLPGQHSVHFKWNDGHPLWTGTGYAEALFRLNAEAGKTYLLRAQKIQDRQKVRFWIEDVETGVEVGTLIQ